MLSYPDFRYKQIVIHRAGGSGERAKFRADNIVIENRDGEVLFQHSCHRLFALFIIGEVTLTSVLISKATSFAFPVILLNRNMKVVSRINCVAEGNTLLREKQYSCVRSLEIAKALIYQKVTNQRILLEKLRSPSAQDKEAIAKLSDFSRLDTAEDGFEVMGFEGNSSSVFFQAYFRPMKWNRREPRCKRDINNLLLDIGYTYLFNFVDAMLSLYGFDLYRGVLHTCFYHRKSLVCDLVEPFRCIIDRRLRKAHNLGQIHQDDFFKQDNQWSLAYKQQGHYIGLFMKDLLEEKERIFRYCQAYYRWFLRERPIEEFPNFRIYHEE